MSKAITETQPVAIKPLEWTRSTRAGSFVAHGAGVMYAADQDHDCVVLAKWEGSSVLKSAHDTMKAAQEFAQSDYEARILSALSTQAVDGKAEGWKLVPTEATVDMVDAWEEAYAKAPEGSGHVWAWEDAYRAMLAASPEQGEAE